jgi:hypothetical protein
VKAVLQKCRKGDTILLAFAGHGLQFEGQKDGYFCPNDARPFAEKTDSLISLGKIYAELDASFAAVKIMLVDACRNDPLVPRGSRGVDADTAPPPPRGVAALFSCSAGQTAIEDSKLQHGVFFYYVLQGLMGAAKDADNEVTIQGLSSYVSKQVAREVPKRYGAEAQQSPNLKADLSGIPPVVVRVNSDTANSGKSATSNDPPAVATNSADPPEMKGSDISGQEAEVIITEWQVRFTCKNQVKTTDADGNEDAEYTSDKIVLGKTVKDEDKTVKDGKYDFVVTSKDDEFTVEVYVDGEYLQSIDSDELERSSGTIHQAKFSLSPAEDNQSYSFVVVADEKIAVEFKGKGPKRRSP